MNTKAIAYVTHYNIINYTIKGSILEYEKFIRNEGLYIITLNMETGEQLYELIK